MICELINPSDPYTLETDSFLAAAVGIAVVGSGNIGLRCEEGNLETPILFGWDEWFVEHGIADLRAWLQDPGNRNAVAVALESVLYGRTDDREMYLDMAKYIDDPAKLAAFRAEFQDRKRSSMNDIGTACWETAKWLRGEGGAVKTAAPMILVG